MSDQVVSVALRRPRPEVAVIDVSGDVTPSADEALTDAHMECEDADAVILNFEGLKYMNSGGIGLLVTMLVRAQRQEQQLLAYGLSPHYRQIFSLTRLDDAIGLFDDEAEALAHAGAERNGLAS